MSHDDLIKDAHVHEPGAAGVQCDIGQVLGSAGDQAVQQLIGQAVKGETAGHDGLPVVELGNDLIS